MTNIANIITSLNEKYMRHPSFHRGLPNLTAVRSYITIIAYYTNSVAYWRLFYFPGIENIWHTSRSLE